MATYAIDNLITQAGFERQIRCEGRSGCDARRKDLERCPDCLVWHCLDHGCDCPAPDPCPNCGQAGGEAVELPGWQCGPDSDDWSGCSLCVHDLWASRRGLPTEPEVARIARAAELEPEAPLPDWMEEDEMERARRRAPVGADLDALRKPVKRYEEYVRFQQMDLVEVA